MSLTQLILVLKARWLSAVLVPVSSTDESSSICTAPIELNVML